MSSSYPCFSDYSPFPNAELTKVCLFIQFGFCICNTEKFYMYQSSQCMQITVAMLLTYTYTSIQKQDHRICPYRELFSTGKCINSQHTKYSAVTFIITLLIMQIKSFSPTKASITHVVYIQKKGASMEHRVSCKFTSSFMYTNLLLWTSPQKNFWVLDGTI